MFDMIANALMGLGLMVLALVAGLGFVLYQAVKSGKLPALIEFFKDKPTQN